MGLVDSIVGAESGGNPNARNERSSAGGAGQFINETWLAMLAKHRPDLAGSRDDLLALKSDPALSREMTAAYAADNAGILKQNGLPVTPGTQYLAHFAGPQGAVGILNADPATPAAAVFRPDAMKANPFLAKMTAGDVAAWADRKMGGAGVAPAAPMSIAGPPAAADAPPAPPPAQPAEPARQQQPMPGPSPGIDISALAAVPQLQNILPPRLRLLGRPAPFSWGRA